MSPTFMDMVLSVGITERSSINSCTSMAVKVYYTEPVVVLPVGIQDVRKTTQAILCKFYIKIG